MATKLVRIKTLPAGLKKHWWKISIILILWLLKSWITIHIWNHLDLVGRIILIGVVGFYLLSFLFFRGVGIMNRKQQ